MKIFALALLLCVPLTACSPEETTYNGYIEGELVMVAATSGGLLAQLNVERGQAVAAGAPLFALDLTELDAQYESAKADLAKAEAQLSNLLKGERPEELEVLAKQREQAEVTLLNAEKEYNRKRPLVAAGATSQASLDDAEAAFHNAQARLGELDAQIKTARLGARDDEISAARAGVDLARQTLAQAAKKQADAAPKAPVAGVVDDTFYLAGEYITAGQPVVSLLAPENVKVRFYLPQNKVTGLKPGDTITVSCDGCSTDIPATVTFISNQTEYTPPVIYSVESRQKLVFLVEAKPQTYTPELRPGLPVDIHLAESGS